MKFAIRDKWQQRIMDHSYIKAIIFVFIASLLAMTIQNLVPHAGLTLLFVSVVLLISSITSTGPSIFASLVSFFILNFFFTAPKFTLEVHSNDEVTTLFIFLFVSVITGQLAARMHDEIDERQQAIKRVTSFLQFSRQMSSAADASAVYHALLKHLQFLLQTPIAIYIDQESAKPKYQIDSTPQVTEQQLQLAWHSDAILIKQPQISFIKLQVRNKDIALVAVEDELTLDLESDVVGICEQASVALDRIQLVAKLDEAKLKSETEQLRTALLSSISHDLRTPLSSIIGGTESVLEYRDSLSTHDQVELLSTVLDESKRLDRHIQNLLDMTRLSHGKITLQRDWVDIRDLIASACNRLKNELESIPVNIKVAENVPLLWVHGALVEQAIVNLLDNAARYTPTSGEINIDIYVGQQQVMIEINDQGPGIPADEQEQIFDMFYSMQRNDRTGKSGTGLGLAIVKGMIHAHSGTVTAQMNTKQGRGTCMRICLPINKQK